MGKNNRRQMGSLDNSRRAKSQVHFKTKVDRNKRNLCTCQTSTYNSYRGRKFFRKGCHRTCPNFSNQQRFLQYVLTSSKKYRRFKTNNNSSTAERVYVETTFSNGYTDKSVKFGKTKRLGNISGPDRCISTHSNTQVPSEISSFQHSGTSVSVLGSTGPSQSPRCFTKIISVVTAHLRMHNMRLASYLDDWLKVNAIRKMLLLDRERLLNLCTNWDFLVNWEKSSLVPSQNITFIGAVFHFQRSIVLPTQERINKLHSAIHSLIEGYNKAHNFLHLLGLMTSCIELIPNARLYMRPIQLHLSYF